MSANYPTLNVFMNRTLVGALEKTQGGRLRFCYEKDWITNPNARPLSYSLPLTSEAYADDRVFNFFDNLLPDNLDIRARIKSKFHINTTHPFDLLAHIGKDCVGAIQILKPGVEANPGAIQFEPLTDKAIAKLLHGYKNAPLGMVKDDDDFRISIAGAQEKTALIRYNNQWGKPLGTTPTTHILKLPIGFIHHSQLDLTESCENEWLCLKIASHFGLPVAPCELKQFDGTKVLVVERFDRRFTDKSKKLLRLPQEDLCQALGLSPNLKYQSDGGPSIKDVMELLMISSDPSQDREIFFRAQIVFWMLAAIDGHGKNFSLFIGPEGRYRLTPLYDILSAFPLIEKNQLQERKIKMAMALKGKNHHYHWHNVARRHFLETAKWARYSPNIAEALLQEVLDDMDRVTEAVKSELPKDFPKSISEPIFNGMQKFKSMMNVV